MHLHVDFGQAESAEPSSEREPSLDETTKLKVLSESDVEFS